LLATQQHHILSNEAKDLRDIMKKQRKTQKNEASGDNAWTASQPLKLQPMSTRRKLFCLSSPTDAFGAKLEHFWDMTLLRSPNRIANLMRLDSAGAFLETPSRRVVLDRKTQHLDICPDSQVVVRNCQMVERAGLVLSLATVLAKVVLGFNSQGTPAKCLSFFLKPSFTVWTLGISFFVSFLAGRIRREYFFKYSEDYRRKDMSKIPKKIWLDS
jgi:hypothetical protein